MEMDHATLKTEGRESAETGDTAIFHWTYRAELTNDSSFRVNQK